jgi:hypothetical protein
VLHVQVRWGWGNRVRKRLESSIYCDIWSRWALQAPLGYVRNCRDPRDAHLSGSQRPKAPQASTALSGAGPGSGLHRGLQRGVSVTVERRAVVEVALGTSSSPKSRRAPAAPVVA